MKDSGIKHDSDKIRMDLLPMIAVEELAKVLSYGAKKYSKTISLEEGLWIVLKNMPNVTQTDFLTQEISAKVVMINICAHEILAILNDKEKIQKLGPEIIKTVLNNTTKDIESLIKSVINLYKKPNNVDGSISALTKQKNCSSSKDINVESVAETQLTKEVLISIIATLLPKFAASCVGSVTWDSACLTIVQNFYNRHLDFFKTHHLELSKNQFQIMGTGANNWRKGIVWSRVFAATLRHLFAWWRGQDIDEESGLPHIAHALCCVAFLAEYNTTRQEFDDRP